MYIWADRACRELERESSRQGAAVLGLPIWAEVFCLFLSLWLALFSPGGRRKMKHPYPHASTYTLDRLSAAKGKTTPTSRHIWLSECQKKYTAKWNTEMEVWYGNCVSWVSVSRCVCVISGYLQDSLISWLSSVRISHNRSTLNNLSIHLIRSTYLQMLLSHSHVPCSQKVSRDVTEWLGFKS